VTSRNSAASLLMPVDDPDGVVGDAFEHATANASTAAADVLAVDLTTFTEPPGRWRWTGGR
jgi:hypothetical protein